MTTETPVKSSEDVTLRVAEGLGKDAGRGIARLDPKDMARAGVSVGDIVRIVGERTTAAKAMPAFADERGKGQIQLDGITRTNARTALDRRVKIERMASAPASKIVLRPLGKRGAADPKADAAHLGRALEGLPLVTGDRVRTTQLGPSRQDFEVTATTPREGCVVVHAKTQIAFEQSTSTKDGESTAAPVG